MPGLEDAQAAALISLGLDKGKAAETLKTLKDVQAGFQGTQKQAEEAVKSLRRVAEQGAKLREVGATGALLGGAILAPFIAAANEYQRRYGQLEKTSRDFTAAQQASADANARLGRVAAQQLTPILNQVADAQARIAAFAEAHPDIAKAAIMGGAGLVAGGGALVMAGTAISSIAKAMELLKGSGEGGGFAGSLGKAAVTVGALAAGAEIAVKGMNLIGEATGNEYLAHYQLTDALKTAREILAGAALGIASAFVEAKKTWGELGDVIGGVWQLAKSGVENFVDQIATGIRDLLSRIEEAMANFKNGLITAIAGVLRTVHLDQQANDVMQGYDWRTDPQQNRFNLDRENNQADLAKRQAQRQAENALYGNALASNQAARNATYTTDQANLANFAGGAANFANTGSLGGGLDGAVAKIKGLFGGASTSLASAGGTGGLPPEATQAWIERNKALAANEKQFGIDLANLKKGFNDNELKAARDKQAQLTQIDTDTARAEADLKRKAALDNEKAERDHQAALSQIDLDTARSESEISRKYATDKLKAAADFARSETEIDAKAALDQRQRARDHNNRLLDLSASRDVVGFLQEQRNYNEQEKAQATQETFDKRSRQAAYAAQAQERDTAQQQELDDLHWQADQKRQDLNTNFAREQDERTRAQQQELDDLRQQADQKRQDLNIAFAREQQDRQIAYDQQVEALRQKQAQEKTAIDTDFAQKLAGLSGNLAGLNSLQAGYYAQQTASLSAFVNANAARLQDLYNTANGYTGGSSAAAAWHTSGGVVHGSFKSGLDYVPQDMIVQVHRGEGILTAEENQAGGKGRQEGPVINFTFVSSDVASKQDLHDAARQLKALMKAGYAT